MDEANEGISMSDTNNEDKLRGVDEKAKKRYNEK